MTLLEYLEQEKISLDLARLIIYQSSEHNENIEDFLENNNWYNLPLATFQQIMEEYDASQINLRTGEIIKPTYKLKNLSLREILKNISFNIIAKSEVNEFSLSTAIVLARTSDDSEVETADKNQPEIQGVKIEDIEIFINHEAKYVMSQESNIHLDKIDSEADQIYIIVFKGDKKIKYDNVKAIIKNNDIKLHTLDVTEEMNAHSGAECFRLDLNKKDWVITPVGECTWGDIEDWDDDSWI